MKCHPRIGIRQIDEIRQRLEIGRDTYGKGKIAFDTASQLCHILKDFSHIMEGYHVESYRACATSTLQEAENVWIVLEQVYQKTGIRVEILSNSEQRFSDINLWPQRRILYKNDPEGNCYC